MDFAAIVAQLAQGVAYTVVVTLSCAATGLLTGLLVAGLWRLNVRWLRWLLDAYTFVLRGVPVLVLLFLVYFGLPSLGLKVSPLTAMVLSLGLMSGAYLAEVFRGALDSVEDAEIVAAEAMGFSRLQVMVLIEFPQMLRLAVPGMVNQFTVVLKYSPFAYTVGIPEITKQAMSLASTTLRGIEIYLAVGLLYFAIYRVLLIGVQLIERRLRVPGLSAH
jgi:polar amino acid transport system permease protein